MYNLVICFLLSQVFGTTTYAANIRDEQDLDSSKKGKPPIQAQHMKQQDQQSQRHLVRQLVYYSANLPSNQKQIAITFDDVPDNFYTPKVLEILRKYQVKATFFILGKVAVKDPEQLKKIVKDGHVLGNHTWYHSDFRLASEQKIERDLLKNEKYILSQTGLKPLLIRPPFGRLNKKVRRVATRHRYTVIHWSVDPKDWDGRSAERILNLVKKKAYPGAIILLHAGGNPHYLDGSIKALPKIIEYLRNEQYQIVPLHEMLHLQPYSNSQ